VQVTFFSLQTIPMMAISGSSRLSKVGLRTRTHHRRRRCRGSDESLVHNLLRGRDRSIGGDLDVGEERSK
jgi:hypothetical protein